MFPSVGSTEINRGAESPVDAVKLQQRKKTQGVNKKSKSQTGETVKKYNR